MLVLHTGDKVAADGYVIEAHGLVADEASLTGEADPVKKAPDADPWCRSGTQVGRLAGRHACWGKEGWISRCAVQSAGLAECTCLRGL